MNYCLKCGQPVTASIPPGDNRPRLVCGACGHIQYENPKMVVGCVAEFEARILLCKRAIEPRYGYWTVPAGFMELGETVAEAALRETWEEAQARVDLGDLFAVVDVVHAGQVHVFFRGTLRTPEFGPGEETLETRLVAPPDLPWDDIAFPSVTIALRRYLATLATPAGPPHLAAAQRLGVRET
jgi:ADP-ribose pyrophosphatase YjhB (NUDIX family)